MKFIKRLAALLLVGTMLLGLVACGGSAPTEPVAEQPAAQPAEAPAAAPQAKPAEAPAAQPEEVAAPKYGGSITAYTSEFYNDFDPASYARRPVSTYIYDMLWNVDWSNTDPSFYAASPRVSMNNLTGQLAEDWQIEPDFSAMTVKLVEGVHFQTHADNQYDFYGGRELVAEDVKWSYDRLLGLDGAAQVAYDGNDWNSTLYMLAGVEVIDTYTVKFTFSAANEIAVSDFMCAPVYIAGHEWDTLTEAQKADWRYAYGTGPYYVTEFVQDSYLTLTKNENYWDYDDRYPENKLPYLDSIDLVYIPDSSNLMSQFIAGEVDVVASGFALLNASERKQIMDSMDASEYSVQTNFAAPMSIGLKQGGVEALEDVRVRQALQYAINLEEINSEFFQSTNPVNLSTLFTQSTEFASEWTEEQIESYYTYNPEKAKAMLAEAGYPDGFEFECVIFSMLPVTLFEIAAEYLAEVGVTMKLTVGNTPPEMTSVGADPNNPACVFFNIAKNTVTDGFNYAHSTATWNYIHQDNPELDATLEAMKGATTMEEMFEYAHKADQLYTDAHYMLMISSAEEVNNFYSTRVMGRTGNEDMACDQGYAFARYWVAD